MGRSLAFFGAFNPPTRAHVDLAEISMKAFGADYVIFVPSKSTYIINEQKKDFAFSEEERIMMLRQIAENRSWFHWTDIEMKQPVQPRTYETLCRLRDQGEHPALLLGADKLPELDHLWQNVRKIAEEFGIVCMDRGDLNCEEIIRSSAFLTSLNISIVRVPETYKNYSSSGVRHCLSELYKINEELQMLLPPELNYLPSDLIRHQAENNNQMG